MARKSPNLKNYQLVESAPRSGFPPAKPARGRWQDAFLAVLRETANVRQACAAVGIARKTAYNHREKDAEFASEWDAAMEDAADLFLAHAVRLATDRENPNVDLLKLLLRAFNKRFALNISASDIARAEAPARAVLLLPEIEDGPE